MLDSKLVEYMDGIEKVLVKYAPKAVDLALVVMKIEAATYLALGAILIIAAMLIFILWKIIDKRMVKSNHYGYKESDGRVAIAVIMFFTVTGLFIGGMINLLNIWYWIGLFNPEIYAIYKFVLN